MESWSQARIMIRRKKKLCKKIANEKMPSGSMQDISTSYCFHEETDLNTLGISEGMWLKEQHLPQAAFVQELMETKSEIREGLVRRLH